MVKLPLEEKIQSASVIIEGTVVDSRCFWDVSRNKIFTAHTILSIKSFKGAPEESFTIIAEGGEVDGTFLDVSNGLKLQIGYTGIFFLQPFSKHHLLPDLYKGSFQVFGALQGFFKYDTQSKKAIAPFEEIEIGEEFFKKLSNNNPVTEIRKTEAPRTEGSITKAIPVVNNLEPSVITAGTKQRLTIRGSGFGNNRGGLFFPNADDGGSLSIEPLPREIILWQDDRIIVEVPSNAGTGRVQVNAGAFTALSPVLQIVYAKINFEQAGQPYEPYLVAPEKTGGYIFRFNNNFAVNIPAGEAFARATSTWRCNVGVNWFIGPQTEVNEVKADDISVVRFAFPDELPAGVLGVCYSWYKSCRPVKVFVSEKDIVYSPAARWHYETGPPPSNAFDFETVTLHELGHGLQLGHVINPNDLMHYTIGPGRQNRQLNEFNIAGARDVLAQSTVEEVCGNRPMALLTFEICEMVDIEQFRYQGMRFGPNPATDYLNLKYNIDERTDINIELFNTIGQRVLHVNLQGQTVGFYSERLVLPPAIRNGMYFLRFTRNGSRETFKIIIK
jgi:hypothetical protein